LQRACNEAMRSVLVLLLLAAVAGWSPTPVLAFSEAAGKIREITVAELPHEVRETLARIKQGGLFPYERDGIEFRNREKLLPMKARGYYREYTVRTPGARDRGARRIVAGGCADGAAGRLATTGVEGGAAGSSPRVFVEACGNAEYYYSDDHYRSFRRIQEQGR
jgi:ribonuclease T1